MMDLEDVLNFTGRLYGNERIVDSGTPAESRVVALSHPDGCLCSGWLMTILDFRVTILGDRLDYEAIPNPKPKIQNGISFVRNSLIDQL
ncbi:hypothetical protein H6G89_23805 [Oscillatoria sp. FACHB-1407]|uniref:hypothetical protein n=1 Tax=Oscillatoria sp. FACHB-1407 TaxID=2692847 RepID=UPI0016874C48|nr:hypothetical protein [Oscillatoria sp. FACHB-1407]MBD2464032.1 hypothetical protein [Oscillatoria sp. FACHB-1407]